MLITVAFLCGILTRLPTHADKFPDTCPCFPLYPPPREFVKYFSLLSLFLSEYYRFIRTKLLHILSNALYFPFFLNSKIGNRSYSITFSCFSGRLVIVCESLHLRFGFGKEAGGRKGLSMNTTKVVHVQRTINRSSHLLIPARI